MTFSTVTTDLVDLRPIVPSFGGFATFGGGWILGIGYWVWVHRFHHIQYPIPNIQYLIPNSPKPRRDLFGKEAQTSFVWGVNEPEQEVADAEIEIGLDLLRHFVGRADELRVSELGR